MLSAMRRGRDLMPSSGRSREAMLTSVAMDSSEKNASDASDMRVWVKERKRFSGNFQMIMRKSYQQWGERRQCAGRRGGGETRSP
jgi:hypothetical protein